MQHIYRLRGYKKRLYRHRHQWQLTKRRRAIAAVSVAVVLIAGLLVEKAGSPLARLADSAQTQLSKVAPFTNTAKPFGLALGDTTPWMSGEQLQQEFAGIAKLGTRWIRIDVAWNDVQPDSPNQYNWTGLDRVVTMANRYHLHILGTLAYTPKWAALPVCSTHPSCEPANDSQFAKFVAAATKRYAPQGIHAWEIWNEPNLEGFWRPAPSPVDYTKLLEVSYHAIKHVDARATVVTGGLGPLDNFQASITQQSFLADVYAAGAKPYFDAVGYHPYSFPALPSYVADWNSWSTMADISDNVRAIMLAHGDDSKKVWITEYGAPTGGPGAIATVQDSNFNAGPDHVNEALQAEMVAQATTQYKQTKWLGNFFWYSYQDLGTSLTTNENFFGLLRYNGSFKPAYYAYRNAIASK